MLPTCYAELFQPDAFTNRIPQLSQNKYSKWCWPNTSEQNESLRRHSSSSSIPSYAYCMHFLCKLQIIEFNREIPNLKRLSHITVMSVVIRCGCLGGRRLRPCTQIVEGRYLFAIRPSRSTVLEH